MADRPPSQGQGSTPPSGTSGGPRPDPLQGTVLRAGVVRRRETKAGQASLRRELHTVGLRRQTPIFPLIILIFAVYLLLKFIFGW